MIPADFVDLDDASRRALEFDELLQWVASYAASAVGREYLVGLEPLASEEAVAAEIAAVDQARRYLDDRERLLPARMPDPRPALGALGITGVRCETKALRDLASVAMTAGELKAVLQRLDPGNFPDLHEAGSGMPDLRAEARDVLEGLDAEGRIQDGASAELRRIRVATARVGERLRRMLERYLKAPAAESVIRDDFITQRNGRFVIPVRTDTPRPVHGIVHGSSSSGATRFVEPLESVELNNERVRLADEERDEEERILTAWTEGFRRRVDDVDSTMSVLSWIDGLQARALFGRATGGVSPRVGADEPLRLRAVRHPLLDRRLQAADGRCVPFDLGLDPADRVLVVSGPNTGGKTVALKSIGLSVLMAQCGIPVPADDAQLPLYRQVRADIGDHQSIEADLSTYSAHIGSVVEFLESPQPPALFLFDEIGTGTEPTEGAALAQAILEAFRVPGITVVATTHLGALKSWAFTNEGAVCAAMEFDDETLRPTYRVLMNVAGTSAGLDIATRLGLDRRIVARAREQIDPSALQSERYLRRLRDAMGEWERRQAELDEREREVERSSTELEARLVAEADSRRRQEARLLDRALEELRAQGRKEIAAIRDGAERHRTERRWQKAERRIAAAHGRGRSTIQREAEPAPDLTGWRAPTELQPGMTVRVRSLSREGVVRGVRDEVVDVALGSVVFNVARDDVFVRDESSGEEPKAARRSSTTSTTRVVSAERSGTTRELNLLGVRVDEALDEVDRFLDRAVVAGVAEIRIVHGHGTGRLRKEIRRFLEGHTHVASFRPGRGAEGGDGATIVTLH